MKKSKVCLTLIPLYVWDNSFDGHYTVFGTYNDFPLYFQLSNRIYINTINEVTSGLHFGFLSFQILFKFDL